MNPYVYHTAHGEAVLNRGDDVPLKRLGKFKSEQEALAACKKHYDKVCALMDNTGRPRPEVFYV